jgi:hypothetical protein
MNEPEDTNKYRNAVSIEEAADIVGCAPAFIRLAIDCGCPFSGDKIAPVTITEWVGHNLDRVRKMAGLSNLPPMAHLSADVSEFARGGYLLLTIAEYQASRSSDPKRKAAYETWVRRIQQMIDQGPRNL